MEGKVASRRWNERRWNDLVNGKAKDKWFGGYQEILDFWFDDDVGNWPGEAVLGRWFRSSPDFDAEIAFRFASVVQALSNGLCRDWADTPMSALAAVIAMDQFPRNMYRGTVAAFSCDPLALETALYAIDGGFEADLKPVHRLFLYLPLEHSELPEMQDLSVAKYSELADEAPEKHREVAMGNLRYAKIHRDLIIRFGRFPHRNVLLGRPSTREEAAYLAEGGETFGQTVPKSRKKDKRM